MKQTSSKRQLGTEWERLSTMSDSDIDLSENEELDQSFFENATLRMPQTKKPVSIRLDEDVIDWYKKQGSGYQTRMNAVLRMYMEAKSGNARKVPSRRRTRSRKKHTVK